MVVVSVVVVCTGVLEWEVRTTCHTPWKLWTPSPLAWSRLASPENSNSGWPPRTSWRIPSCFHTVSAPLMPGAARGRRAAVVAGGQKRQQLLPGAHVGRCSLSEERVYTARPPPVTAIDSVTGLAPAGVTVADVLCRAKVPAVAIPTSRAAATPARPVATTPTAQPIRVAVLRELMTRR